jgi:hypothetical protein
MDVSFLDEKRFVSAKLHGTWDIDELPEALDVLREECRARQQDLLQIDMSPLKNDALTTFERFQLGVGAASLSPAVRRLATVARPDQIDSEQFGARVARNRGLDIRIFSDPKEAGPWLLRRA